MAVSDQRLEEYAQRQAERKYVPRFGQVASLMNCEVDDLVTEIQNLRTGIRRLRERYATGNDPRLSVGFELMKLPEGRFE